MESIKAAGILFQNEGAVNIMVSLPKHNNNGRGKGHVMMVTYAVRDEGDPPM